MFTALSSDATAMTWNWVIQSIAKFKKVDSSTLAGNYVPNRSRNKLVRVKLQLDSSLRNSGLLRIISMQRIF
ncbi:hypothetical protein L1987_45884 [Smallanthus sonchifolius]|uniref:Uncharacterized protein n=1 Tax=Smallanthus sonchifolius TaxID=185202 RepID=A0ACB9FYT4_9ASTR|nr:hypothetical protein L1987_45884 [Smallanthus sonchifolius]